MEIHELFKPVADTVEISTSRPVEITGIANDSRKVKTGELFFALPGQKTDGARHIADALNNGAAAIVTTGQPQPGLAAQYTGVAWISSRDILKTFSFASAAFFGRPSEKLQIVGITGTKGKTTTSYFLEAILKNSALKPGVIGTIDYRIDGKIIEKASNTTPMANDLHRLLARMHIENAKNIVMEVSSHALALKRSDDVAFDIGVFTNLQSDHLDFHKNREDYFKAKLRLFELLSASPKKHKTAIINSDDEKAQELRDYCNLRGLKILDFGIEKKAAITAAGITISRSDTSFLMNGPEFSRKVSLKLLGKHNVYNALAAITAALASGIPLESAVDAAEALRTVPGRLERIELGQAFSVFVDYAHTDAGLESALQNLQQLPHAKIITVFGCGGDRDRTKRAPMGKTAASLSDHLIVTSDNPRSEDPAQIFSDIEEGLKGGVKKYIIEPDRKTAIEKAVSAAAKDDIILIAGKGHEDYQILKNRTIHFDDREEASAAIKKYGLKH